MSTTQHSDKSAFLAGADLSAAKLKGVKRSSGDNVVLVAASTDKVLGVLQNKPTAGQVAVVQRLAAGATLKVIASGNIAINDDLMFHTDGTVRVATSGNRAQVRALDAAASGDVIEVVGITDYVVA